MLLKKEHLPKLNADLHALYHSHAQRGFLQYGTAFELLCAVIMSAQCTDARVNKVAPRLFERYPDAKAMAAADTGDIAAIIRPTGFYHSKAKAISESAKILLKDFGGVVPGTMEELLTLRGVARKTANVVLQDYFGINVGVVVDTHVKRLAFRLGLTRQEDPIKVEADLMKLFSKKPWHWLSRMLIMHGRKTCHARAPRCDSCQMAPYCPKNGVKKPKTGQK